MRTKELLFSKELTNFNEDENYIYVDAVVIYEGTIDRAYGKLFISAEELKKAKDTLKGKPVLIEHRESVDNVIGQVIESKFENKGIIAALKVVKKGNERLVQLIRDKIVNKLSAGFYRDLKEISKGKYEALNISFVEVSFVLDPAFQNATTLKKEDDMSDLEALRQENTALKQSYEMAKAQLEQKEKELNELKEKLSVLEKEVEGLKELAEIGKKYEQSLREDATKFVKIAEGEDSPILGLIDKADVDQLKAIVDKYSAIAKEKLKATAKGVDPQVKDDAKEVDINKASYEELKKLEEKFKEEVN